MKRTNQIRTGNIPNTNRVADIPRNAPYPRHVRRFMRSGLPKIEWPKWIGMSNLTLNLVRRAGVMSGESP